MWLDVIVACALCIVDVVYICEELWALDRKGALWMSVIIVIVQFKLKILCSYSVKLKL